MHQTPNHAISYKFQSFKDMLEIPTSDNIILQGNEDLFDALNISSGVFSSAVQKYCGDISLNISSACEKYTGIYCYNVSRENYAVNTHLGIPSPSGTYRQSIAEDHVECSNQTIIQLCPTGFYCPTAYEKLPCSPGHSCFKGNAAQSPCAWGIMGCPFNQMATPLSVTLFFGFSVILVAFLVLYKYHEKRVYNKRNADSKDLTKQQEEELRDHFRVSTLAKLSQMHHSLKTKISLSDDGNSKPGEDHKIHSTNKPSDHHNSSLFFQVNQDLVIEALSLFKHPLDSSESESLVEDFSFRKINVPLTITFDSLCLRLKSVGRTAIKEDPSAGLLLNNVFGFIKPFEITALMGPSGAGKTTLLALLRGQAHYAQCEGNIRVNNTPISSLSLFSNNMAFVPQDDVVYEELSVEDNIMYSAKLFNRRGLIKTKDLLPMVNKAMKMLSIEFIRFSTIGGGGVKGISGGQRKRVSIGMEMVKEAALFLLDEPTSGLDSATSVSVLHTLHELSELGVNVVATIHQPRQEILDLIHSIVLLAPCGRVAYFGSPSNIKKHFSKFGYNCPINTNAADFMMDCLAGFVLPTSTNETSIENQEIQSVTTIITGLCTWWKDHKMADYERFVKSLPEGSSIETLTSQDEHASAENKSMLAQLKSTLQWAYVSGSRQKKIYFMTFSTVIGTSFTLLVAGIAVGYLIYPISLKGLAPALSLVQQVIVGQLVFGIFVTNASLRLFGCHELCRIREETGGMQLLPYCLGKVSASYVDIMFFSYAFLSGYYSVLEAHASFLEYWGLYLLLHLALSGISNIMAVVSPSEKMKDLGTLGVLVVLWLFGGVQPPYPKLKTFIPVIGPILNGLSPFCWSFRIHFALEMRNRGTVYDPVVSRFYHLYGIEPDKLNYYCGMLVFYWVVCNILTYLILILRREDSLLLKNLKRKLWAIVQSCPAPVEASPGKIGPHNEICQLDMNESSKTNDDVQEGYHKIAGVECA